MATKTLAQKLYVRAGNTVALLNAPKGAADLLAPLPPDTTLVTKNADAADVVLCFVKNGAELTKNFKSFKDDLRETTVLWFAYPKQKSKGATDLTRDNGWQPVFDAGYQAVATVAIDDTWSGIRFRRGAARTSDDLIAKQYAGERAAYLPIYERLVETITNFGPDIEVVPRQSYVAFSRVKQFALLHPTRDRLDVVIKLPRPPLNPRLEDAAGIGSGSMTHRVVVTQMEDVDHELLGWLRDAYRATAE